MAANDIAAYAAETQIAIAAVRRACVLTASVFNKLVKQETLTKDDKSPVTGACSCSSRHAIACRRLLQLATSRRRRW